MSLLPCSLWSGPVPALQPLNQPAVDATIRVYSTITSQLLPTPARSHYTFNLRDLSKVFQGILMAKAVTIEVVRCKRIKLSWHNCIIFMEKIVPFQISMRSMGKYYSAWCLNQRALSISRHISPLAFWILGQIAAAAAVVPWKLPGFPGPPGVCWGQGLVQ